VNAEELLATASRTPATREGIAGLAERLPSGDLAAAVDQALAAHDIPAALALLLAQVEAGREVDIRQVCEAAPFADGLEEFAVLVGRSTGKVVDAILDLVESRRYGEPGDALALFLAVHLLGSRKCPPRLVSHLRCLARAQLEREDGLLLGLAARRVADPGLALLCGAWIELAGTREGAEAEKHALDLLQGPPSRVLPTRAAPVEETGLPVQRAEPKVGRNDPCPCGSGKKFKKCCGAEGAPAVEYAPVPQQLSPERLAQLRPHQLAALDFAQLTAPQLVEAARTFETFLMWQAADRAVAEIERRPDGSKGEVEPTRIALFHAACAADAVEVARAQLEQLVARGFDHPLDRLALELMDPKPSALRSIEAAAAEVLAHPEDTAAPFDFVHILLRRYPALAVFAVRGVLDARFPADSQSAMDGVEWARDRLLLPPDDPAWDAYHAVMRESLQAAPATPDEKLAAEAEGLRARSDEAAARAAEMERRMRAVETELTEARAQAEAAAAASLAPIDPEAVQRLRAKVDEYEGQIAEGNRERQTLRKQLADVSGRLTRTAAGPARAAGPETPPADPEEQDVPRPERLPVLVPTFAKAAEEALRAVAALAGGDAHARDQAKRLRRIADVWSARVGIHSPTTPPRACGPGQPFAVRALD